MRILYLCQRIPFPPDRGDRIPVFHEIKHLRKNHEVIVGSLDLQGVESDGRGLVEALGIRLMAPRQSRLRQAWNMAGCILAGKALTLGYFSNSQLYADVRAPAGQKTSPVRRPGPTSTGSTGIDAVIVFSSSMAQYVEDWHGIPRIMHFCDVDSLKWQELAAHSNGIKKWIYAREARLLLKYERKIAAEFSASCVVTPDEAELFKKHIPGVPVHVLENGVDVDYFAAMPRRPSGFDLVFVGVMDYPPNMEAVTWFAHQVWPEIQAEYADARFTIVGSRPCREVQKLTEISGIRVTGRVPDIRPYLASATLMVAPIEIARGVQNKVLEAMAAGLPVLTTPAVAKGLAPEAQKLVMVSEREPKQFAAAVRQAVSNAEEREARAVAAAEFVRRHCSWDEKLKVLDGLLEKVLNNGKHIGDADER